ncbi:MAG: hypothetical protein JZU45_05940 [Methyloversatilis discipulorum]|uniref:hypothetical protein n=1 Tax=Methyloversatilis discipulorum TaxID=1119528 RepID=UPI0026F2F494|nr:hypothetical protein [Methyloversatilis discipulorum]MBV5285604.1 hypothetical protein [Methyloversatilis discipulorum]
MMVGRAAYQVALGPLLWGGWFVALYALHGLLCEYPIEEGAVRLTLLALSACAVLVSAVLAGLCRRRARDAALAPEWRFTAALAGGLHGVAAVSMLVIAAPLFGVAPCT